MPSSRVREREQDVSRRSTMISWERMRRVLMHSRVAEIQPITAACKRYTDSSSRGREKWPAIETKQNKTKHSNLTVAHTHGELRETRARGYPTTQQAKGCYTAVALTFEPGGRPGGALRKLGRGSGCGLRLAHLGLSRGLQGLCFRGFCGGGAVDALPSGVGLAGLSVGKARPREALLFAHAAGEWLALALAVAAAAAATAAPLAVFGRPVFRFCFSRR